MRAQRPALEPEPVVKLGSIVSKQVPDAEKRAKARFLVDMSRTFASAQARSTLDSK